MRLSVFDYQQTLVRGGQAADVGPAQHQQGFARPERGRQRLRVLVRKLVEERLQRDARHGHAALVAAARAGHMHCLPPTYTHGPAMLRQAWGS